MTIRMPDYDWNQKEPIIMDVTHVFGMSYRISL